MAASWDFLEEHLSYEGHQFPKTFQEMEDLVFPLFLTTSDFYELLDCSLEDGKNFFQRDENGKILRMKSWSYDKKIEDLLFNTRNEMVEVNAVYFKEIIWPKISHKVATKIDPILVWLEIQSFIKGSEDALLKGSPLNFDEYYTVGSKMAPNYSDHRKDIYEYFQHYQQYIQNKRHSVHLYDECDLILNLYNRRVKLHDVNFSIHVMYLDEVQDFTQSELTLLLSCCRNPNAMFFTGDTAQNILEGVSFRFQDLRSCFFRLKHENSVVKVPEAPRKLTINYRSHCNILQLAGSVIDLIQEFFRHSIDYLPDDMGMFTGPVPVFIESCEIEDLITLMSKSKETGHTEINLGAHQAVLVRRKQKLPKILSDNSLTIFEAKGLEFDDVLLYNFFSDSLVDETVWRVITSYLEMPEQQHKVKNFDEMFKSRSITFEKDLHKSLNSELKHLYTAITRAKCNLWIYDASENKRLPMLEYWQKRDLIKVVSLDKNEASFVPDSPSKAEEWVQQGHIFKREGLLDKAIKCYERAGGEYTYLVKQTFASQLLLEAQHKNSGNYLEAALALLESDEHRHNLELVKTAANCLKKCDPPKYPEAGKLFEMLNMLDEAIDCYQSDKDFSNFARLQKLRGKHDSIIQSLLEMPFLNRLKALTTSVEYTRKGIQLHQDHSPKTIALTCAKHFSTLKDKEAMSTVLQHISDFDTKVKYMKELDMFDEAGRLYEEQGNLDEAAECYQNAIDYHNFARLQKSQRKYNSIIISLLKEPFLDRLKALKKSIKYTSKGIKLHQDCSPNNVAIKCADHYSKLEDKEAMSFVLKHISDIDNRTMYMKRSDMFDEAYNEYISEKKYGNAFRLAKAQGQFHRAIDFNNIQWYASLVFLEAKTFSLTSRKDLNPDPDLIKKLENLTLSTDNLIKAEAFLLLGIVQKTKHDCVEALKLFSMEYHAVGILESFNMVRIFGGGFSDQEVLHYCEVALELSASFLVCEAGQDEQYDDFFGLKSNKDGVCTVSKHGQLWQDFSTFIIEGKPSNNDGMMRLDYEKVTKALSDHYENFISMWLKKFGIGDRMSKKLKICEKYFGKEFLLSEMTDSSSNALDDYIQVCEWGALNGGLDGKPFHHADVWFELDFCSLHLNPCFIHQIRSSAILTRFFEKKIILNFLSLEAPNEESLSIINSMIWKIGCIMENKLDKIKRKLKRNQYVFSWIESCFMLKKYSDVLTANELCINHFLKTVLNIKDFSISASNISTIVTIYSMYLMATITHSRNPGRGYKQENFIVPSIYAQIVEMFDYMHCQWSIPPNQSLFLACMNGTHHQSSDLHSKCIDLLSTALCQVIGTDDDSDRCAYRKATCGDEINLTLILGLTLFGNLSIVKPSSVSKHKTRMRSLIESLHKEHANQTTHSEIVKQVLFCCKNLITALKNSDYNGEFTLVSFSLVKALLKFTHLTQNNSALFKMSFCQQTGVVKFTPYVHLHAVPMDVQQIKFASPVGSTSAVNEVMAYSSPFTELPHPESPSTYSRPSYSSVVSSTNKQDPLPLNMSHTNKRMDA